MKGYLPMRPPTLSNKLVKVILGDWGKGSMHSFIQGYKSYLIKVNVFIDFFDDFTDTVAGHSESNKRVWRKVQYNIVDEFPPVPNSFL